MNVDELASAFQAIPGGLSLRVERVRLSDGTDVVRLVPPPFQDEAAGRLRKLARAAAAMFGLKGPHEPEERWWRFVLQNTLDHPPSLLNRVNESVRMQGDAAVTATMRDAAKASARVARKCRHLVRVNVDKSTRPVDPYAGELGGTESDSFTPTPADRDILEALAKSTTTLIQADIEQKSGQPISTVKGRLPILEKAGLVDRPHGARKGYAISAKGRAAIT